MTSAETHSQRARRNLRQFVKFALVGGTGVIVNLAVFNATMRAWELFTSDNPLSAKYLANALGFVVSVLTNYALNRRWTFRSRGDVSRELPRFFTVSVVAYLANLGVFTLCLTRLGVGPNPSQLVAIAAVMPINFVANKLWSFR